MKIILRTPYPSSALHTFAIPTDSVRPGLGHSQSDRIAYRNNISAHNPDDYLRSNPHSLCPGSLPRRRPDPTLSSGNTRSRSSIRRFVLLLCLAVSVATGAGASPPYADKSALSEGKWIKISVKETGIYKLTYSKLKEMGFPDPAKVSIHGYGGWPLEEDFAKAEYRDDVPTVAVWRGSDYLLFYGRGAVKWTCDSTHKSFRHVNNAYATLGYYFVTDATETNDAVSIPSDGDNPVQIDVYDDYMLHEEEMVSVTTPGRPYSGRDLFGESFDTNNARDFKFAIPGITNDEGKIAYRFVAKVKSGSGVVTLSADGVKLTNATINQNNSRYTAALSASQEVAWSGEKSENTTVGISFSITQQTSHLDYIRLQMKRRLQPYGACTFFRSMESENKAAQFRIGNAPSGMVVFDVSDGNRMRKIEAELNGTELSFSIPAGTLR